MNKYYTIMLTEYNDVMSVNDLCSALHIGRNTAYKLLNNGAIKNIRLSRKHLIPKMSVIEYLMRNET